MRKRQILGMIKEMYSRKRYMKEQKKPKECDITEKKKKK